MRFNFCFAITLVTFVHTLNFDPTAHPNWRLLNDKTCGMQGQTRIFGGEQAGLGEFPWMVVVTITTHYETGDAINICGGSLINENYVLTAAHCFLESTIPVTITLRVGEYNLKENPDCEDNICAPEYVEYNATDKHTHPDYRNNVSGLDPIGDIVVLRSQYPFVFNDFVRPICLEYGELLNEDYSGQEAKIIGFGTWGFRTKARKTFSNPRRLQKATVRILDEPTCAKFLKELGTERSQSTENQICAGNRTTFSYIGDSGSPMLIPKAVDGDHPRYYQIAVTSVAFNILADIRGKRRPSIYVRISPYLQWILDVIHD